jgi:hypothetical protein
MKKKIEQNGVLCNVLYVFGREIEEKTDEVIPAQKITAENAYIFKCKIIQLL